MEAVGFIGLGLMGQPMALRLAGAGESLIVWNRTRERADPLAAVGAEVATDLDELFARVEVVMLMLADRAAVDGALDRGGPRFADRVRDHVIVTTGTTAPAYSEELAKDVVSAGGRYIEAPVSGSRPVAEAGDLIGMVAGDPEPVERVRRLLAPVCRQTFACGPVPRALHTKLAVNTFLINLVTGLAEAWAFAEHAGVDLGVLREVIDAGQMSSTVSRIKTRMLASRDLTPQAALADVLYNARLIADAADLAGAPVPLIAECVRLLTAAERLGVGSLDMVAVVRAFEESRT